MAGVMNPELSNASLLPGSQTSRQNAETGQLHLQDRQRNLFVLLAVVLRHQQCSAEFGALHARGFGVHGKSLEGWPLLSGGGKQKI